MPGALEPGEQLEWERRAGRPAGIAATLAAACLLIGLLYTTLVGAEAKFSVYERAIQANDQPHLVIVPTALQAIGYLLFAYALYYLARATRARRSETPRWAPGLSAIAGVLKTITVVLTAIALVSISADTADLKLAPFTERGAGLAGLAANELAAERAAIDVRDDSSVLQARQIIVLVANLALGLALVLVGLNAMRAGLLSRFMGILGIIAGALTILFQGAGIIEAFWLAAIGTIFLDRWPNGRGPAWETGQATPWPSAMDQLPAEEAETETETGAEPEALAAEEEAAASPHPASRKRKRKKRR